MADEQETGQPPEDDRFEGLEEVVEETSTETSPSQAVPQPLRPAVRPPRRPPEETAEPEPQWAAPPPAAAAPGEEERHRQQLPAAPLPQTGGGGNEPPADSPPTQEANRRGNFGRGIAFFIAVVTALLSAYLLPLWLQENGYVIGGVIFTVLANAVYLVQRRLALGSWPGVWQELKTAIPPGPHGGRPRYPRISGFVASNLFVLLCFTGFFKWVVPERPEIVLAFFLALLWFIGTRRAEGIIDSIAEYAGWLATIAVVGVGFVLQFRYLFFAYLYDHVGATIGMALVLLASGYILYRMRGASERPQLKVMQASIACFASGGLLVAILIVYAFSFLDRPWKTRQDHIWNYQKSGAIPDPKEVRFFPPEPKAPPPAPPATPSAPPVAAPPAPVAQAPAPQPAAQPQYVPTPPAPAPYPQTPDPTDPAEPQVTADELSRLIECQDEFVENGSRGAACQAFLIEFASRNR